MSGHMDYGRIQKLYGAMMSKAEHDNRVLEILFHPGKVIADEVNPELGDAAAEDFYLSFDRHVEKQAVMSDIIEWKQSLRENK